MAVFVFNISFLLDGAHTASPIDHGEYFIMRVQSYVSGVQITLKTVATNGFLLFCEFSVVPIRWLFLLGGCSYSEGGVLRTPKIHGIH